MNTPVTFLLMGIIVATSFYAWNRQDVFRKWMFNPYSVYKNKEWYRFITSGIIHQDYMHLIFNMITFYFFGSAIERMYQYLMGPIGIVYFIALFLAGMIISDLPTFFKHKDNPHYNSLGASGGVAAVVFSSIMFQPLRDLCLFGVLCLPGFILGALYLMYSFYMSKRPQSGINHDAHFYGAVFGIAFTIALQPGIIQHFFTELSRFKMF